MKTIMLPLFVILLLNNEIDAYSFQSRRSFFKATTAATTAACLVVGNANAIDVSGLVIEGGATAQLSQTSNSASIDVSSLAIEGAQPGRAPNQPASGLLAGTKLGFQVGGGPRPEEVVRKIDESRYKAATVPGRPNNNPAFLEGLPREPVSNN